jgi:DNA-binding response OmpR family regulator
MSTALLLAAREPVLERHLRSDGFEVVDDADRPDIVLLVDSAAVEACRARHGNVPVIVLRRASPAAHEVRCAGSITADLATRSVTVDDQFVALAGKEYELLLKLMTDPTRVFTKEQLLREVWGFRSLGRTRTLDSHASRLRRKLAAAGAGEVVVNVWGVGYRLL